MLLLLFLSYCSAARNGVSATCISSGSSAQPARWVFDPTGSDLMFSETCGLQWLGTTFSGQLRRY